MSNTGLPWRGLPKDTLVAGSARSIVALDSPKTAVCPPLLRKHDLMANRTRSTNSPDRGPASASGQGFAGNPFLSAEDFDATGILAGVEPCASNYWWMPELLLGAELDPTSAPASTGLEVPSFGPFEAPVGQRDQAARRTVSRSTAAA